MNSDSELDPLVKMALAHYQFEAIHPFRDGNGRTGRILNVLMLVNEDLLAEPILYLSRYVITRKNEYYRLLLDVTRKGDWEDWIIFMLRAVASTAQQTLGLVLSIQETQKKYQEQLAAVSPAGSNADFLAVVFDRPYVRIADVMEKAAVSRPTATRWLRDAVQADLAREVAVGREKLFTNRLLMDLLRGGDGVQDASSARL